MSGGCSGGGGGGGKSGGGRGDSAGAAGGIRPIVLLDELLDGTGPSSFATPQLQTDAHVFLQVNSQV